MRLLSAGRRAILAGIVSAGAICQEVAYLHQFGNLANSMDADDTGVYLAVDDTRAFFPSANTLNRAITLRKFSSPAGVEVWSRELWKSPDFGAGLGAFLASDFSGIYVGINVPIGIGERKPTLRKFNRDGNMLYSIEISATTSENIMAVTAANGFVYIVSNVPGGVGNLLYRVDPANGAVLSVTPAGTGQQVNVLKAGPSGIYSFGSVNPARLRKFDLAGNFVWEREITPGNTVGFALAVHSTGIYAGGLTQSTGEGFLVRFDEAGNVVTNSTVPRNSGGQVTVNSLAMTSDGVLLSGRANGGLPGLPSIGSVDTFVRKLSFNGDVVSTFTLGASGFAFTPTNSALTGNALFLFGSSSGTYPGNTPSGDNRAALARIDLPAVGQRSLASILSEIPSPAGNSLMNRTNAICGQLSALLRDIQNQRGPAIPTASADLAAGKIGEVQTMLGCTL